MVKIENITQEEEERKLKIKRIDQMVWNHFDVSSISFDSNSLRVGGGMPDPFYFLTINPQNDEMTLAIPES